jgi:hypothetical protein
MSDCCTPGSGFPNASLMQQMATNNAVVWEEICMLQQAILAASSQCQLGGGRMCTTVGGTTPMTFVSGVESIVTEPYNEDAAGYGYYEITPAVKFIPPNGVVITQEATASVITNGGSILHIMIESYGVDYSPRQSTINVDSGTGVNAILSPLVNAAGQIVAVSIVNAGIGYSISDSVSATRALAYSSLYTDAVFNIASVGPAGEILSVQVTTQGSGYEPSVTTVQVVSSLDSNIPYPAGTGFQSTVITDYQGGITRVQIDNPGWGYSTLSPYVVLTDSSGSGATTSVTLNGVRVGTIRVITPGSNYTQSTISRVVNPVSVSNPSVPANLITTITANTFGTTPMLYWQVWAGIATNKPISTQINAVLTYFKSLGYTISMQSNPATTNTLQWKICW